MFQIRNLKKNYVTKKGLEHQALNGIDLDFGNRGFVVVLGKSGSGKSTLMNILGGLDRFNDGEIIIKNKSSEDFSVQDWDSYRNTYVGFVFQEFYIIEEFSIGKNIALSLELQGYSKTDVDRKVDEILKTVELEGYANRKPNEISGGQKQRIAIARALIKDPEIILADEPTGNLDSETGKNIMKILKNLSKDKLVVMVTHDREFAMKYADRIIELKDGEVISDEINICEDELNIKTIDLDGPIEKLIKLPTGKPLSENSINIINNLLTNASSDYYLSLSSDDNYIGELAPELVNDENSNEKVINKSDYLHLYNDSSNSKFKLIKSQFAFKNALKMAFSSLFKKKIRLVLMTFLFLVSLTLFGLSLNFARYNVNKASVITFKEQNISKFEIKKIFKQCNDGGYCYKNPTVSKAEDVEYLRENYSKLSFYPLIRYNLSMRIFADGELDYKNNTGFMYNDTINNIAFVDEFSNIELLGGNSKYPVDENEILITDYLAEMFIKYKVLSGVNNSEELINKELTYNDFTLKISGIIDTSFTKQMLNEEEYYSEYYQLLHGEYSTIYVLESFEEKIVDLMGILRLETMHKYQEGKYSFWDTRTHSFNKISKFNNDLFIVNGRVPQSDDEILVSEEYALQYLDKYNLGDEVNNILGKTIEYDFVKGDSYEYRVKLENEEEPESITRKYKIVGIYQYNPENEEENNYYENIHYVTDDDFNKLYQESKKINSILVNLSDDVNYNNKFIVNLGKRSFQHNTIYSRIIYQIDEASKVSKKALLIAASVFGVFAGVMIFTFISNSINAKRKEIGTLRAIGSSGLSVAKIFVTESLIIGVFTAMLSSISVYILTNAINGTFQDTLKTKLTLLYTDLISIVFLLLLAIVIVFISSFIPLRRITREKPIDAIKLK